MTRSTGMLARVGLHHGSEGGRARTRVRAASCVLVPVAALLVALELGAFGSAVSVAGRPAALSAERVEAWVFPVTWADYRQRQQLVNFESGLGYDIAVQCATRLGVTVTVQRPSPPPRSNNQYFEDPAFLRQFGFGIADATFGPPGSTVIPTPLVQDRFQVPDECTREAARVVGPLEQRTEALFESWMRPLSAQESSAPLQAARSSWSACMGTKGYAVASQDDFASLFDRTYRDAVLMGSPEHDRAVEMALALDYADCLGPVVEARGQLRTAARDEFVRGNASELDRLRRELPEELAALGLKYGTAADEVLAG